MKHIKSYHEINEGFLDDSLDWIKSNAHVLLPIAEIGSFFIPVIGPFLSMGFGLGDAALYAKEGDKTSAGITAAFSILPAIGGVVGKIPGIKQLGKEGMETLGKKVAGKEVGALTKTEKEVLQDMGKNSKLIQKEVVTKLENNAAAKFDPRGCALTLVKESLRFSVLNEACREGAWKMVQLATHDPSVFLKYREKVFTQGPTQEFLQIEKTFQKFGKETTDGILVKNKKAVAEIQRLNQESISKFEDMGKTALHNDIPFDEIRLGEHAKDYMNRSTRLNQLLADGSITQEKWAKETFDLNRSSIDFMESEAPRWQALARDGESLRTTYQQIGTGTARPNYSDFT